MRLMRIGPAGAERPVAADDQHWFDATSVTGDFDPVFFATDGIARLRHALRSDRLPRTDITGERIGAPITRPGVILCVGMNYAAHAAETGAPPPKEPVLFYKAPNTIIGPGDEVRLPPGSVKTDWEVELAVVIGRRARYLASPQTALDHVAGYTISNDVSERALQLERDGGQWSAGKSCETFNPLGPWLLTADQLPDPQTLRLTSSVNGQRRQDSTTNDMIFTVATLIWAISQVTVLDPGDVINTGTPEGVALSGRFPYLADGDRIQVEIDHLGSQTQTVAATRHPHQEMPTS